MPESIVELLEAKMNASASALANPRNWCGVDLHESLPGVGSHLFRSCRHCGALLVRDLRPADA